MLNKATAFNVLTRYSKIQNQSTVHFFKSKVVFRYTDWGQNDQARNDQARSDQAWSDQDWKNATEPGNTAYAVTKLFHILVDFLTLLHPDF
jgi:hypothetical protein